MIANIVNIVKVAAWATLVLNLLALAGAYLFSKALLDSKAFWLRALMDPSRTSRDADAAAKAAVGCLRRIGASALVLAAIYLL